jgi:hypothetical protein
MAVLYRHRKTVEVPDKLLPDGTAVFKFIAMTELLGEQLAVCNLCGGEAAAYWASAHSGVSVCRPCAVEVLPMLAAEAVVGEFGTGPMAIDRLEQALAKMQARFWRAAAMALANNGAEWQAKAMAATAAGSPR